MLEAENGVVTHLQSCIDCVVLFENLTQSSLLLLHYHNTLDHTVFDAIRALSGRGFLPKDLIRSNGVKSVACQTCKSHIKSSSKKEIIAKTNITDPRDFIHMDQAQSSTPGRSLIYIGRNKKKKICFITIFLGSVSKKVFCEFQNLHVQKKQ